MTRTLAVLVLIVLGIVVAALVASSGDDPSPGEQPNTSRSDSSPIRHTAKETSPADDRDPTEPAVGSSPAGADPSSRPPDPTPAEEVEQAKAVTANTVRFEAAVITLKMFERPILEALGVIGDQIGLPVSVHPDIAPRIRDQTITFDFQETPARAVLDFIRHVKVAESKWVVTSGGVELQPAQSR
jgi:hypothetical protein